MIKIGLVLPFNGFIENVNGIFNEHNKSEKGFGDEDFSLDIFYVKDDYNVSRYYDVDVIIARGLYLELLKKYYTDIPLVEIIMSGSDLLYNLLECKKKFKSKVVGIIASRSMLVGAQYMSGVVDLYVNTYEMNDIYDRESLIIKAVNDGCDTLLAGCVTCELAEKMNINALFLKTRSEAFYHSITEAKRAALISRREQEKRNKFSIVLDYSLEGIIFLDNKNIINIANNSASDILKIPLNNLINKSANEILVSENFKSVMTDTKEYKNEIIKTNDTELNLNKAFVYTKGDFSGAVISFLKVQRIQELETKIRKKIYARGHVAKFTFNDILGNCTATKNMIIKAKKYSTASSNILLIGESGTGKEILAQSIHNESCYRNGPFVAVNCASLPESLIESELFGYSDGAFTGASKGGKPGFFELAHTGTIFLDEIGELPLSAQAKLLRVIQEKEIIRIGDDRITPIDIRIIAATNVDLEGLVEKGIFRKDLYYRLNVLLIDVPSLNDRQDDILILINHFLNTGTRHFTFDSSAKKILSEYNWKGNIRQLINICARLSVLYEDSEIDKIKLSTALENTHNTTTELNISNHLDFKTHQYEQDQERNNIINVLEEVKYNKGKAAEILNIHRSTLWHKMKKYGI